MARDNGVIPSVLIALRDITARLELEGINVIGRAINLLNACQGELLREYIRAIQEGRLDTNTLEHRPSPGTAGNSGQGAEPG